MNFAHRPGPPEDKCRAIQLSGIVVGMSSCNASRSPIRGDSATKTCSNSACSVGSSEVCYDN